MARPDPQLDSFEAIAARLTDFEKRLRKIEKVEIAPPLIEDVILSGDASEIEFSNISQHYRHLKLIGSLRAVRSDATADGVRMRFNDRAGSVYTSMRYYGRHETTTGAPVWTSVEEIAAVHFGIGHAVAALGPADVFSPFEILIPNYTVTTFDKMYQCYYSFPTEDASEKLYIGGSNGIFSDDPAYQAVESIQIWMANDDIASLSRLTLYGLE